MLRYLQGRTEEAQRCWERTLECNPNYFYACRTLAVFHYLRGDPAARAYLQKCKYRSPQRLLFGRCRKRGSTHLCL